MASGLASLGAKKLIFLSDRRKVTSLNRKISPSRQVTMSSSDVMRISLAVQLWAYWGKRQYSPLE